MTGKDTFTSSFGPPKREIEPHVWATCLDRILVLAVEMSRSGCG